MFKKMINKAVKETIDKQQLTTGIDNVIEDLKRYNEELNNKILSLTKVVNVNSKYQEGLQQQWTNFIKEQILNNSKILNRITVETIERKKADMEIQIQINTYTNSSWFKRAFKRKKIEEEIQSKTFEALEYYNKKLTELDTEYLKYNKAIKELKENNK